MRNDEKSSIIGFLSGAFIGGVVGAALAMMFTPVTGEEAREILKKKAKQVSKKVGEVKEDLEPKFTQVQKDVKKKIGEMVE